MTDVGIRDMNNGLRPSHNMICHLYTEIKACMQSTSEASFVSILIISVSWFLVFVHPTAVLVAGMMIGLSSTFIYLGSVPQL